MLFRSGSLVSLAVECSVDQYLLGTEDQFGGIQEGQDKSALGTSKGTVKGELENEDLDQLLGRLGR